MTLEHKENVKGTFVLYGNNHKQWHALLPQMTPLYTWTIPDTGTKMIRWDMPKMLAEATGMTSGCAEPGCECRDPLVETETGYEIDTRWDQTGWWFR